jgi:hypothetical protein
MPSNVLPGASTRTMTPSLDSGPIYLAAFDANRPATSVHDDLYARALALRVAPE